MTPYSPFAIANYFISLAQSSRERLDPMKLQKLIYFAHGWHLALYKEPLIDEQIEAWEYGPVVESVYHAFKMFGSGPIDRMAESYDWDNATLVKPQIPASDERTVAFLNKVWEIYGKYSGIQLSRMTHEAGTAWSRVRDAHQGLRSVGIPNEDIQQDFEKKIAA